MVKGGSDVNEYIVKIVDGGHFATIEKLTRCEDCKHRRTDEDSEMITRCDLFDRYTEISNFCRHGAPKDEIH